MPTLTWTGKDQALIAARGVPFRLLEPHEAGENQGQPAVDNLLIQGDNLEALKALLPYCAGQVKCIYIDPPYNTGSAFEHYDDNLEHSTWLSMMYPRLELLRELFLFYRSCFISAGISILEIENITDFRDGKDCGLDAEESLYIIEPATNSV